jgi:hypothetical protein
VKAILLLPLLFIAFRTDVNVKASALLETEMPVLSWTRIESPDFWRQVKTPNLASRARSAFAWTGAELIVYGGSATFGLYWDPQSTNYFDGARYNPETETWTPMAGFLPLKNPVGIWTGTNFLVFGYVGDFPNGGWRAASYSPAENGWREIAPPPTNISRKSVWTGDEWIFFAVDYPNRALRYNMAGNSWRADNELKNETGRFISPDYTEVVWTGKEMIVFGGFPAPQNNPGYAFNPKANSWRALSITNAPETRYGHTAVWTGTEMLIYGGNMAGSPDYPGYRGVERYDPVSDRWSKGGLKGELPPNRFNHVALWTGKEMIVFSGRASSPLDSGGRYNPDTDTWVLMNDQIWPNATEGSAAVWTGREALVWGGYHMFESPSIYYYDNGTWIYNPFSPAPGILFTWVGSSRIETTPSLSAPQWKIETDRIGAGYSGPMLVLPNRPSEFFRLQR